jgi:hypothetical protein
VETARGIIHRAAAPMVRMKMRTAIHHSNHLIIRRNIQAFLVEVQGFRGSEVNGLHVYSGLRMLRHYS